MILIFTELTISSAEFVLEFADIVMLGKSEGEVPISPFCSD